MTTALGLFEAYGIELEYMIVDRTSLAVLPICDQVLKTLSGTYDNEFSLGQINVSNELVLHVIEFKCNGPQKDLLSIRSAFQEKVIYINHLLHEKWNAQLLPTAMHPLMNPLKETRLWPHGQNTIYETYNRIFDCKGHGWSNLQSIHINLPFRGDEEFGKLHAAIRIALSLLPGLAASSPIVEGRVTGKADNRLDFYSQNQKKISSIIGQIIPERAFTRQEYEATVFAPIKRDIEVYDPEGVLEEEWLNSRGAIARFDRDAIEIRLLDIQESVTADFAVISLVISLVKSLVDEYWIPYSVQKQADEVALKQVFLRVIKQGGEALIDDPFLLTCFHQTSPLTVQQLWSLLLDRLIRLEYPVKDFAKDAAALLKRGTLSKALQTSLGADPKAEQILQTYRQLGKCLSEGVMYGA